MNDEKVETEVGGGGEVAGEKSEEAGEVMRHSGREINAESERCDESRKREDGRRQTGSGRLMFSVFLICVITSIKNPGGFLLFTAQIF